VKMEVDELDVVELECEKDWKVEKDEQRSAKDKREPTSTPLSLPSLFLRLTTLARALSLSLCLRLRLRRLVGKRLKSREKCSSVQRGPCEHWINAAYVCSGAMEGRTAAW